MTRSLAVLLIAIPGSAMAASYFASFATDVAELPLALGRFATVSAAESIAVIRALPQLGLEDRAQFLGILALGVPLLIAPVSRRMVNSENLLMPCVVIAGWMCLLIAGLTLLFQGDVPRNILISLGLIPVSTMTLYFAAVCFRGSKADGRD